MHGDVASRLQGAYHLCDCGDTALLLIVKVLGNLDIAYDAYIYSGDQHIPISFARVQLHVASILVGE